jgi:hypothetical protein
VPVGDDLVDTFGAVIPVELRKGEEEARVDVLEGVESPTVGLVEEGIEPYPAGGDVGGGEREDILAGSGLSTGAGGVNLDKTGGHFYCDLTPKIRML